MLLACLLLGCHADPGPRAAYDRIDLEISSGNLALASSEVEAALRRFSSTEEWLWRFRIQKARILASQSNLPSALGVLEADLPERLATSEVGVQKVLFQGVIYRLSQKYEESERAFVSAEQLATSWRQSLLPKVLIERGALEIDRKNYPLAGEVYHRALSLAREQQNREMEAAALVNLARLAISEEHLDEGIDQNETALRFSRSLGMQTYVATSLGNMGWAYFQLGDFENALEYYKEGAEQSERSGLNSYGAYFYTGVANSYLALHDYASAEELSKRTLIRARSLNNAQTIDECLNTLAEVTLRTARLDEAEQYNQEALKLEEIGADHFGVLDSLVLSGRIKAKKGQFDEAKKLFLRVLDDPGAETWQRWGVQARLAELDDARGLPVEAEKEYRKSIQTFEKARSTIGSDDLRLSFLSGAIEFYDDYVAFLIRRGRPEEALSVAELSRAQTLEEGLSGGKEEVAHTNRNVRAGDLARRLNATLLFYWLGEGRSYIWVITAAKTTCITLPASSEIDGVVKSYREAVATSRDVAETEQAAGEKLYAILVAPTLKFIPQNSRVILLPDGSLYSLNFETLIVSGPKPHFWIEDVTLSTASSLSLLASGANRAPPKQKNLLLVGDALKANDEFEPLPLAEDEMQSVEHYFPEVSRTVLKREQATPAAYLASNPERYAYLHFVTHGTASRAQPLESAVILSKEPASDAYKLYARDIVKRHLNAELVTISACNGSGKRTYSGEGLVGLSWAFLRAGAHNVVGALWEVSNAPSTSQLMDAFYNGLSRGEDPATALREAKLSFLRSTDSKSVFKKPYYWAPFQLYAGS